MEEKIVNIIDTKDEIELLKVAIIEAIKKVKDPFQNWTVKEVMKDLLCGEATANEIFKRADELESIGLGVPQITRLMREFNSQGFQVRDDLLTVDEAKDEILKFIRRKEDA